MHMSILSMSKGASALFKYILVNLIHVVESWPFFLFVLLNELLRIVSNL